MSAQFSYIDAPRSNYEATQSGLNTANSTVFAAISDMLACELAAFSNRMEQNLYARIDGMTRAVTAGIASEARRQTSLDATRFAALHDQLDSLEKLVGNVMNAVRDPSSLCACYALHSTVLRSFQS
jgi:hypothetical protein